MTSQREHSILISPVGELSTELIEAAAGKIRQVFGFSTETSPILQDLSFALDENRNQYHSTAILDRLAANTFSHTIRVLAIAQVDLFIPILTHVYGEAQLGGKACIVSTIRLNEGHSALNTQEPFFSRIIKEAIHELGHTFKLRHCREHTCLMHYCRNENDVDRKSDQLCRYCKILLEDEMKRLGVK